MQFLKFKNQSLNIMWKLFIFLLYSLFIASIVHGKLDNNSGNRHEQLIDTYEKNLTGNILKSTKIIYDDYNYAINETWVPSVKQGEDMLKEMCEKNAKNEEGQSFNTAHTAVRNIEKCFDGIISFSELPAKIEEARPNGNLDQVFHGYCRRSDEMKRCVQKFLSEIDPCLADDQKNGKYTVQNITDAILGFACENEGDYIALFISEKGPQCISSQQPGIEQCVRKSLNDTRAIESYIEMVNNFNSNNTNVSEEEKENILSMNFELDQCKIAYQVRNCIVAELKKCKGSTPANVIESIFNLIRKSTTCSKYKLSELDPDHNKSSNPYKSTLSFLVPVFTILLNRLL